MNKVREFYNKDASPKYEDCNYMNILGLALLLKRNGIEKIDVNNYEDFKYLISKNDIKENILAKKIIDSMLMYSWSVIEEWEKKQLSAKDIYNILEKNEKKVIKNVEYDDYYEYEGSLSRFIEKSIEISKFSEKDIIDEITRPMRDYMIKDYNDIEYYINEDISKLMVQVLNIEKDKKIATMDLNVQNSFFNNNGIIESQIILQTENSNIDAYYYGKKKLNREIREYAVNAEVKQINKNLYLEYINELYDYIIISPGIISSNNFGDLDLEKLAFNDLDLNNLKNSVDIPYIMVIKMLNALNKNGKGIARFSLASLSNILEREIRKKLIDKNYIEKVIKVNDDLLVIFNKNKEDENISFIDLENDILSKKYNCSSFICTSIDMKKAIQDCNNNLITIKKSEIINNDYSLNPDIYTKKIVIKNATKLETVLDNIFRGYQISKEELRKIKIQKQEEANYKILEIGNINDYGEIESSLILIDSNKIGRNFDRYLLKDGDIVITARGEKIKLAYIELKENEKIIANGSINVIRVDKNKMNSRYLKMFFDSSKGKQTLENIKIGRKKTPSLNTGSLKKIKIPCPTLEEQESIAKEYEKIKDEIDKLKNKLKDIINNF